MGEYSQITVEALTERFEPMPGYTSEENIAPRESGYHQKVLWSNKETISANEPIRIKVSFSDIRPEDLELYAIYLEQQTDSH